MSRILKIALELDIAEIAYELDDRTDGVNDPTNPHLRLKDHTGDTGAIILARGDKLVYYFWEALAGCHTKDYEFVSTSELLGEFDRFILTFYRDTVTPNPYFI
jgi:hypothetical protein